MFELESEVADTSQYYIILFIVFMTFPCYKKRLVSIDYCVQRTGSGRLYDRIGKVWTHLVLLSSHQYMILTCSALLPQ